MNLYSRKGGRGRYENSGNPGGYVPGNLFGSWICNGMRWFVVNLSTGCSDHWRPDPSVAGDATPKAEAKEE